ncbi:DUF2141 domain-containing protein [Aliikangiella maris]|uniref:DUF2141 domain-containing protein n=2 Tax=Aliikangiella maris TaxID=3162458 RepID=A0ABV2BXR4_9GAMM
MKIVPVIPSDLTVTFSNISAGRYAILVFHDENSNGKLDRMMFLFMGISAEGYC